MKAQFNMSSIFHPTATAAEHARVADRPCRGAQDRSNFDERFPDLST
jgi:hypothetical protein